MSSGLCIVQDAVGRTESCPDNQCPSCRTGSIAAASSRRRCGRQPLGSPLRMLRYETRCWRNGVIPDVDEAVDSPQRLTNNPAIAQTILERVPDVPTPVWGRDELRAGEMWNSNSLISWLLVRSGLGDEAAHPPAGGRALPDGVLVLWWQAAHIHCQTTYSRVSCALPTPGSRTIFTKATWPSLVETQTQRVERSGRASDGSRRSDRTRSQPRLLGSVSIGARNAVADAWRWGVLSGPNMMSSSGADPTRPCSRSASSPRPNARRPVLMVPATCGPELPVSAEEVVVPLVSSPECRKVARPTIAVISAAAPVRTPGSEVQKARNPLLLDVLGSGGSSEEGMSYSRWSQLARTRTQAAARSRKYSTTSQSGR
jgi:hypothetical protein